MLAFDQRILFIGYGAVAQCTLPILLKHVAVQPKNITVLDFEHFEARTDVPDGGRLLVACYPGASVPREPRDPRVTLRMGDVGE